MCFWGHHLTHYKGSYMCTSQVKWENAGRAQAMLVFIIFMIIKYSLDFGLIWYLHLVDLTDFNSVTVIRPIRRRYKTPVTFEHIMQENMVSFSKVALESLTLYYHKNSHYKTWKWWFLFLVLADSEGHLQSRMLMLYQQLHSIKFGKRTIIR